MLRSINFWYDLPFTLLLVQGQAVRSSSRRNATIIVVVSMRTMSAQSYKVLTHYSLHTAAGSGPLSEILISHKRHSPSEDNFSHITHTQCCLFRAVERDPDLVQAPLAHWGQVLGVRGGVLRRHSRGVWGAHTNYILSTMSSPTLSDQSHLLKRSTEITATLYIGMTWVLGDPSNSVDHWTK